MPAVQYLEVRVELLRPNPFNPNRVSAENERKIRASIERIGLFKPIIVREVPGVEGYEIIGGQHRWEQACDLGHPTIQIANLGEIDDARAKEVCLADNAQYGSDDTLVLSEILKDIGADVQDFLPYGDTDLAAIFSATSIDLDAIEMPLESGDDAQISQEAPEAAKPAKTHTVMRFKISIADAERLTALIARTKREQDFRHEDDLTNAGDALVHLLGGQLSGKTAPATTQPEDWDDMLQQIEDAQREEDEE